MSHGRAVALMVLVTLMWSTAGVVTRHLEVAHSFEVTFWRSLFNALAMAGVLTWLRGPQVWAGVLRSPWPLWVSGASWAVMYTAFMVAITMTSVANVLVTLAMGPLITALFARVVLNHQMPMRTWVSIAVAAGGIAWMFGLEIRAAEARSLTGTFIALCVPVAASVNWTLLQHQRLGACATQPPATGSPGEPQRLDMLPAVFLGASLSALLTLPFAWPVSASGHDVALLAGLGVFQLALPCLLVVRLASVLSGPEVSLLGLLEVLFGVLWAWWLAGERPTAGACAGGLLVLGALVVNETLALRERRRTAAQAAPGAAAA